MKNWNDNPRWKGITRNYSLGDVQRLQGSIVVEHTLAHRGAAKLWELFHSEPFVNSLGHPSGGADRRTSSR